MKYIDEIRRDNIRIIESELGSPAIAAKSAGMSLAQYLNLRDGAKDSKTGKRRGMRKETAWKFEDGAGKPRGWLDIDHASDGGTIGALAAPMFALPCTKCGKVSHKSFIDLETQDDIACSCGASIHVADYYGISELETILKSFGGAGFSLRKR